MLQSTEEVLAIIPARGNSKGIPRKNLQPLAGKPLLAWTVEAARKAGSVTRVLVSTEDAEVAEAARRAGAEVPFLRPREIAGDEVHAVEVVLHALDWLRHHGRADPALVVMLLPTSPLRRAANIDEAVALYRRGGADSIVSVQLSDKHLLHLRSLQDGYLRPIQPADDLNVQRQDLDDLYALNGSIYVSAPETLRRSGSFHLPATRPYVMSRLTSIDVNSPEDLVLARALLALETADALAD